MTARTPSPLWFYGYVLIQRDQLIAGRPAVEMRELMRQLKGVSYSVAGLARMLSISATAAERLSADLIDDGLVESDEGRPVSV